ncbi:unnamed protein product [Rotaria sp. Silwood2]|nr:unnamed protein product [Rotaria sp. Silwood2]CAF2528183.1 unnamed protein product [Rotaria sp. Silwood2]CAF2760469.1 unnamed protein product [Rotaria sp. Silwood2]CAF2938310.1 unnamed protein product [Rotaria sp. Silwood2]CAF3913253.1 unnamed protein product [Rotaria sp. Silwood2]
MNETTEENKIELPPPPLPNVIEDSIASRTKEITKRPKRERSPTLQIQPPAPKIKKIKEVAPKLSDKTKWTMEEQKQFFTALRIYGKNFEALGQCFNTRRRLVNPEAQKRTFGQIRCFYYRSFRTVSKLCAFTEEEKSNVDSLELRSVLAYLCLKPKVKCFDKKPAISILHQLIRNGSAFLRVKGQREHVSIIGKALKPPKTANTIGSTKQTDRTLSKHIKILLSPASPNAYMRVALSCRYPHVEVLLSRTTTLHELIDRLTQYWQLNNHAQSLFKDDLCMEQLILYPHGSYLSSSSIDPSLVSNDSTPILDLSSSRKQIITNIDKQSRSRSDSELSTEPLSDPSSISQSNLILKRNNLSENEPSNESIGISSSSISPSSTPIPLSLSSTSAVTTSNKSNLARTAMLLAAKRAASNNHTNNYDASTFTLIDSIEDEADSNSTLFKQRFDILDLIDEFPSEDEVEPETNTSAPIPLPPPPPTTTSSTSANNPTVTLADISQGITRNNSLFSILTIGELQKLLQRPKELRLIYDFNNLSRTTNTNDCMSPTSFLRYVIQMANQCLTAMADRQSQLEMKTTKKPSTKKQQTSRSKCYCSCCTHQHPLNTKEQRRPSAKAANSPNAEICALLQMPQSIPTQDMMIGTNDDILTVQTSLQGNMANNTNKVSDGDLHNKPFSLSQIDEQPDIFDTLSWSTDAGRRSLEQIQAPPLPPPPTSSSSAAVNTTTELPSVLTLLLPMMSGTESTSIPQPKQSSIIFSSNNGVIDDPLIQSLAAEQAASAHNYDLLSHRHKRVRRPLRYGDQSTRPSNIQLLIDANINAQQTAAANQRLMFSTNNTPDLSTSSNDVFRSDCENPNDLLNDNTNMSTVSLSTTIVNAALQSNTSRLRLDWPDNMSDLSFGSFPDLLESNTLSSTPGELNNFEQSTITDTNEQNKCVSENSISEVMFTINSTTNLLLQN